MSVNWRDSVLAALAAAGIAASAVGLRADDFDGKAITPPPAPKPVDRAEPPPAPKPSADSKKASPADPTRIFEHLIEDGRRAAATPSSDPVADLEAMQQKTADARREGLIAYQQAMAASQANRPADALRLARKANTLFPNNADITSFLAGVQREANATRLASTSVIRAKAMLAAAANRGQELMRSQRSAEGEDLLLGVIAASKLFSDPAAVDLYRRLAERSLDQYRADVRDGSASAEPAPAGVPQSQPRLALAGSQPPENVRRLLRSAEGLSPAWYIQQKALLAKPISVDYRRTPVALALDDLAEKTGLTFVVDRPVAAARTHVNALLDLRVSDLPAESILDLACQKAQIEYVVMERSIVITTRKALEYVRQLPEALRYNWAVGKVLFPDVHPELFATENNVAPPTDVVVRSRLADRDVPAHLRSGNALVSAVQNLLKK